MYNIYHIFLIHIYNTLEDIMPKQFLERGVIFSPEQYIYIYIYIYIKDR